MYDSLRMKERVEEGAKLTLQTIIQRFSIGARMPACMPANHCQNA